MSLKNNFDLNIIKSNKMEFTDDFIHSYKQGITKTLFEKVDFESVNCFIRVSNFEYV